MTPTRRVVYKSWSIENTRHGGAAAAAAASRTPRVRVDVIILLRYVHVLSLVSPSIIRQKRYVRENAVHAQKHARPAWI